MLLIELQKFVIYRFEIVYFPQYFYIIRMGFLIREENLTQMMFFQGISNTHCPHLFLVSWTVKF